jgi:hypothetical protein
MFPVEINALEYSLVKVASTTTRLQIYLVSPIGANTDLM